MSRQDNQVKSGTPSVYKDDRGGGTLYPHPVLGIVKDNVDPSHNGRIRVYLTNYGGGDPNDSKSWVTVSYMSPWFGATAATAGASEDGKFLTNSQSYGFWATAPDVGTQVICIFVDGKPNQGYYVGCLPPPGGHHMVPAIAAASNVIPNENEATTYGGADRLPVTEINTNNPKYKDSTEPQTEAKPIHSYQASILATQGLIRDNVRGVVGSSSMRETPSAVFGLSTPGAPIWDGGYTRATVSSALKGSDPSKFKVVGRTGGHSLVMDDGELFTGRNQMIRLRSSGGHQITMSDDAQVLFITHSNGNSWVELGPEGTVDIFSTNSFNVRTQGDINFHADRDINMQAGKNFNVNAESFNLQTTKNVSVRAGADSAFQTVGSHTHKAGGAISLGAGGDASLAGGTAYINGGKVNLNTGKTGTTPKDVPAATMTSHVETQFSQAKGWLFPAETPTMSITSRLPTHQPYALAGKGVDVKTSPKSSGTTAPSAAASAATAQAAATPPAQMTSVENAKTVPPQQPAPGTNVTGETKQAIISQNAVTAAAMSAADKAKAGVIPGIAGLKLPQLDVAGIVKAGAGAAIGALMARGVSFEKATSQNSFTGVMGVTDAPTLVASASIQASVAGAVLDNAGLQMIDRGIITGKESPTQIAGLMNAVAQTSAGDVAQHLVDAANQSANATASQAVNQTGTSATDPNTTSATNNTGSGGGGGLLSGTTGTIIGAIAGGTFAGLLADKGLLGSGSLANSLSDLKGKLTGGIDNLKGNLTAGLSSLTSGLTDLKGKITGLLSSNPLDALKSSAQKAFAAAEASFTNLKAGFPNPLGGAQAPAPDSPQQKAANDYDVAKAEKDAATAELLDAKKVYYENKTPENLAKVTAIEERIAAANKKLTASSAAFLGVAGGSLSGAVNGLTDKAKSFLSSDALNKTILSGAASLAASKLPSNPLTKQLFSAEGLQAKATQLIGGAGNIATTLNSGANALPGGLGSMVAQGTSALSGVYNFAKNTGNALANGSTTVTGALTSLGVSVPAIPTVADAKGFLNKLTGAGSNAAIQINTAVASISGGLGAVIPPIGATATADSVDITAKVGQLLGDSRIPVPTGKPLPPPDNMTPAQVDTQVAAKDAALKNLQLEEKVLGVFQQKYGADAATSETAAFLIKKQEDKVAMARATYDKLVNAQA